MNRKRENSLILNAGTKTVIIAKDVDSIVIEEGFDTEKIKNVRVDDDNPVYYVRNKCLINRETGCVELMWNGFEIPESEGIVEIGDHAFFSLSYSSAKNLTIKIPEGVEKIGAHAFANARVSKASLPVSLKEIGYRAFASSSLNEIFIPENVEKISIGAFHNCQMKKIEADEKNKVFYSENNCLIERKTGRLLACCNNPVIPEGVNIIEQMVLSGLSETSAVFIPSTLTEIRAINGFPKCLQYPVMILENKPAGKSLVITSEYFVHEGSYGEEYCLRNDLACRVIQKKGYFGSEKKQKTL